MNNKYKACNEMDLTWEQADIDMVRMMYNSNFSILEMSAVVQRPCDEIAILILDLTRQQEITARAMGVYGLRDKENEQHFNA